MKHRGFKKRDELVAEIQDQINRGETLVVEIMINGKLYRMDDAESYEKYGDIVLAEVKRLRMRMLRDKGFGK